jgi:hypothetical protein
MALAPDAKDDYASRFDRMDERISNGQGYTATSGNTAGYAWGESYVLMGYAEMYHATRDTLYLDRLVEQFDRVLANRDDVRKLKDADRHVALAGWGSTEYTKGKWHVWAVHTGMICLGPMDFVALVKAEARLKKRYGKKAEEYLARIKECVAAHDADWHDGPGTGEGYYSDPDVGPLPLNQQNALGTVELGLYLVTRDHIYRDRVMGLARFMQNRLRRSPDGSYDWSYWPKPDRSGTGSEDISHAAINVQFMVRCNEAHVAFSGNDMSALAKTWNSHVRRAAGEWSDTVGGTGGPNTYTPHALALWLDLAPYDRMLFEDAKQSFAGVDEEKANGADLLGFAKLAHAQKELSQKKKGIRLPKIKMRK